MVRFNFILREREKIGRERGGFSLSLRERDSETQEGERKRNTEYVETEKKVKLKQ